MKPDVKTPVEQFYSGSLNGDSRKVEELLDSDVALYWNSSAGFKKLGFEEISELARVLSSSFESLRPEISHLLADGDMVTIRFTYYVRTIENPDEEVPMAHFIAIWQVRDGKLYKGHQISQQADDSPESLDSFLPNNA